MPEQRRGHEQHRQVDQAGRAERDEHVEPLEAEQLAALGVVAAVHTGLGQGRVQVDDMRHDGSPDDARDEQQAVAAAGQARHEPGRDSPRINAHRGQIVGEPQEDDAEQAADRQLEATVAALFQSQDSERDHRRDQARRQQPDAEQQVEPDRGADELGQVGRHGDELGLRPQPRRGGPPEVVAAQFRQVAAGRDPGLGGQVLHQHGHQVGGHDRPRERVGGEVARVDVGDRRDERRAEQRDDAARPAARAQQVQAALRC